MAYILRPCLLFFWAQKVVNDLYQSFACEEFLSHQTYSFCHCVLICGAINFVRTYSAVFCIAYLFSWHLVSLGVLYPMTPSPDCYIIEDGGYRPKLVQRPRRFQFAFDAPLFRLRQNGPQFVPFSELPPAGREEAIFQRERQLTLPVIYLSFQ